MNEQFLSLNIKLEIDWNIFYPSVYVSFDLNEQQSTPCYKDEGGGAAGGML